MHFGRSQCRTIPTAFSTAWARQSFSIARCLINKMVCSLMWPWGLHRGPVRSHDSNFAISTIAALNTRNSSLRVAFFLPSPLT